MGNGEILLIEECNEVVYSHFMSEYKLAKELKRKHYEEDQYQF